VAGAKEVRDVADGLESEPGEGSGVDGQDTLAAGARRLIGGNGLGEPEGRLMLYAWAVCQRRWLSKAQPPPLCLKPMLNTF
jgi:hypothetical protein